MLVVSLSVAALIFLAFSKARKSRLKESCVFGVGQNPCFIGVWAGTTYGLWSLLGYGQGFGAGQMLSTL